MPNNGRWQHHTTLLRHFQRPSVLTSIRLGCAKRSRWESPSVLPSPPRASGPGAAPRNSLRRASLCCPSLSAAGVGDWHLYVPCPRKATCTQPALARPGRRAKPAGVPQWKLVLTAAPSGSSSYPSAASTCRLQCYSVSPMDSWSVDQTNHSYRSSVCHPDRAGMAEAFGPMASGIPLLEIQSKAHDCIGGHSESAAIPPCEAAGLANSFLFPESAV